MIISAVVPCYKEQGRILGVLEKFGDIVNHIIVVDDACPENTGKFVKNNCEDPRVEVIEHDKNLGVGGATLTGYARAIELNSEIIVKVDGDGQMDPGMIPILIRPICNGISDYSKGNRFFRLDNISSMPTTRVIGNLILSFTSKMSSGYWKIFDPTNGFTAIHGKVAKLLPMEKMAYDYFFESDMLYRLNTLRAVVTDIPMEAIYGEESSSLKISSVLFPFALGHLKNLIKRIFYLYFLREFNLASLELIFGIIMTLFGTIFGSINWYDSVTTGIPATTGVVILAALPVLIGTFLIVSFLNYDLQNQPDSPLHPRL